MDLGIPFVPRPTTRPAAPEPPRPAPADTPRASFDAVLQTTISGPDADLPPTRPARAASDAGAPVARPDGARSDASAPAARPDRAASDASAPVAAPRSRTSMAAIDAAPSGRAAEAAIAADDVEPAPDPSTATVAAAPGADGSTGVAANVATMPDADAADAGTPVVAANDDAVVTLDASAMIAIPVAAPDAAPKATDKTRNDPKAAKAPSDDTDAADVAVAAAVIVAPIVAEATVQVVPIDPRSTAGQPVAEAGAPPVKPDSKGGEPAAPAPAAAPPATSAPGTSAPATAAPAVAGCVRASFVAPTVRATAPATSAPHQADSTAAEPPLDARPEAPADAGAPVASLPEPVVSADRARPQALGVAAPVLERPSAQIVRQLSAVAEQVKALVQNAAADAAGEPADAPATPAAAAAAAMAADKPAAPDKAQAMARAIVRATVEGLVLAKTADVDAQAGTGTPATTPATGSAADAAAPTAMPHLLVTNPIAARSEARAAYALDLSSAAAEAPAVPPAAPAGDASFGQQHASSGNAAPKPETPVLLAHDAPAAAVFALPSLAPADALTLGGGPAAVAGTSAPVTMTELPHQIVRSIQVQVRDGVSEARLRINPEHLGEVSVKLRVEHGGVTAVLHAESPAVSAWIEAHQDELRTALGQQGLQLDGLIVTNDPDERRQDQQEPQDRPRRRAPRADVAKQFEITV